MSEEEKKAIERIKKLLIVEKCDCEIHTKNKKAVETIINLIENQQKEIEELNTELQIRIKWQQFFEKEYINKDKIRKFIKDELPDDEIMEYCTIVDVNGIELRKKLEELLQENIKEENS